MRFRWSKRTLIFLAVYSLALAAGHAWIVKRLVVDPGLPGAAIFAASATSAAAVAFLVARPILVRIYGFQDSKLLAWPASVWLGVWWILFSLTLVTEVSRGAIHFAGMVGGFPVPGALDAVIAAGVGIAGFVFSTSGLRRGLRTPEVRAVEIELERWPSALDGYRIVQLSDVHIGNILKRPFADRVRRRVDALDADLVVVTGDLVDGPASELRDAVAPLGEIRSRDGLWFVAGNHDFYSNFGQWDPTLRELGFGVLRNEHRTITRAGAAFHLAGVDDPAGRAVPGGRGDDVDGAIEGSDADLAILLLAHQPATFPKARGKVDLQISGHTHGGQIWPFHYVVRMATRWVAGLHDDPSGSKIYVSRGTGSWGPPIRVFAPPEITEITLRTRRAGPLSRRPAFRRPAGG